MKTENGNPGHYSWKPTQATETQSLLANYENQMNRNPLSTERQLIDYLKRTYPDRPYR